MISINGSLFINGLRSMTSALKTPVNKTPAFLSKLSCVTNHGAHSCDTQALFQHRSYSPSQPMKPVSSQYRVPSKDTVQSSDKTQNLIGKRQAPQPPLALATTLKPMLKEFQLLPDMAVAKKTTDPNIKMRPAPAPPQLSKKKRQAPPPPLPSTKIQAIPSELIAKLEQTIEADKQSPDGAAWYARHNSTADHAPKIRRVPMPPQSPALNTELEQMAYDAGLRLRHNSSDIMPTKVRHSLLSSLSSVKIKKPEEINGNNIQPAGNIIPDQQTIHEKLRIALNDFHRDPQMARDKWTPGKEM